EETRGTAEEDDLVTMRSGVRRRPPGADARDETAWNLVGAVVDGQAGHRGKGERGRPNPDAAHRASSASSLGNASSSAASASSKRQRARSGSSISLDTARTSTAGTPARC